MNALEMTFAHEAFHAFHNQVSEEKYAAIVRYTKSIKRVSVVREALADFYSVAFAMECGYLKTANKRIQAWKENLLTGWPYSFAVFFLNKPFYKSYSDILFRRQISRRVLKAVYRRSIENKYEQAFSLLMFGCYLSDHFQQWKNQAGSVMPANANGFVVNLDKFEKYKANADPDGFRGKLLAYVKKSRFNGKKDSEIYKAADINRSIWNDIMNKRKTPRKETVVALALALHLSLQETEDLLDSAGHALSKSSDWDLLIRMCLEDQNYKINDINFALSNLNLKPLIGSGTYDMGNN